MSRVIRLHIGAPKTGTTYLQDRLALNRERLVHHGVHVPTRNRFVPPDLFHFRAALDLLEKDWGGERGHAEGSWDALVKRVRRTEGTVVISHEILAPAKPEKVARAMNDLAFGDPEENEVHVVYSARDLGRQLPAAWQESIKQGRRWTFKKFLNKFERGQTWFHRAFDLPRVLSTWGERVPPERIHLVTVPHDRGPDGDLLWHRFCTALDLDPAWAPRDSERANQSLGVAETQLVRRINKKLDLPMWRDSRYDGVIRQLLAEQVLANRTMTPVRLPPARYDWAEARAERWIEWARASGVHVVGDLDDLRPRRPDPDEKWVDPDKVRARKQLGAAMDAVVALTREAATRQEGASSNPAVRAARELLHR